MQDKITINMAELLYRTYTQQTVINFVELTCLFSSHYLSLHSVNNQCKRQYQFNQKEIILTGDESECERILN